MHLGFCTRDLGSHPGKASGQESQSPHMGPLAIPLEQGGSSSALFLTEMVLIHDQPASQPMYKIKSFFQYPDVFQ